MNSADPLHDNNIEFPANFSWGVATSAYQIEGAAQTDGRGPSIWDTFSHTPGKIIDGSTGDVACDHYNRYEEDVEIIAGLQVDAYRLSIAWPRVQPLGSGPWNEAGFQFYSKLIAKLNEKNIKVHLTLYHWDLPQALQDNGGWLNRDTTMRFAEYAVEVARRFGNQVEAIATHNEPWCTANLGHATGQFAPGMADPDAAVQVSHNLLLSHGLAIKYMRTVNCRAKLGIVLNQWPATPATDSAGDRHMAALEYAKSVQWFMDPIFKGRYPDLALQHINRDAFVVYPNDLEIIHQPIDFLGVNYYTRVFCSTDTPKIPVPGKMGFSDMGWENYPQGLTELLVGLHAEYQLPPIYITENGIAVADSISHGTIADQPRIDYVKHHLAALGEAMRQGVDVKGYFYWSLMDNYEWNSGYAKRFGLIYVDYATQQRTLKDSAHWYRKFITDSRNRG